MLPEIFPVTAHTDHVGKGTVFVAMPGTKHNGIDFIPEAVARGASIIVLEEGAIVSSALNDAIVSAGVRVDRVKNARQAFADLSAQAAGLPAQWLSCIGITGTKGKTTTAFLLFHMLRASGYTVALISTVENRISDALFPSSLTTPQPDYLHQFLAQCVEHGVTHVVMEVSAQAVTLERVRGIEFDQILFTNFGREHLEFYASEDEYFEAKRRLLCQVKSGGHIVLNSDDRRMRTVALDAMNVSRVGMNGALADVVVTTRATGAHGLTLTLSGQGIDNTLACPGLFGPYNGMNLAIAVTAACNIGCLYEQCAESLSTFSGVPGRLETYPLTNGARAIIDYAHNPLSYEAVLPVLRSMSDHLIVVCGAGGERDAGRRPEMGYLVAQYADHVIFTSDNPRSEDPQAIISDLCRGVSSDDACKVVCEPDRYKAIKLAYEYSREGSVIALLGKGRDEYQIIGGRREPFSEREIITHLE